MPERSKKGPRDVNALARQIVDEATDQERATDEGMPEAPAKDKTVIMGDPDEDRISTSYVECQNLTMRMGLRRFTRLTNGFSKKVENLAAAVSLHFLHYNFARPHKSLADP